MNGKQENLVVCFFNSLFTISNNANLEKDLLEALKNQDDFYIVCDFTINSNYHMPKEEQEFIDNLIAKLKKHFRFEKFDILEGRGIIIHGAR